MAIRLIPVLGHGSHLRLRRGGVLVVATTGPVTGLLLGRKRLPPPMKKLLGVFMIRVRFLADVQKKHPRSIQRRSPAPGAAPGATHSVRSLRETTASMRSLILIAIPYIILYKFLSNNLLKIRKP